MECKNCKQEALYHKRYDAYYCEECNIWLEKKCKHENCEFCRDRPEKPLKLYKCTCGLTCIKED